MTPCRLMGCAKGTPEQSKSFSEKNWQAYEHYLECKAVGQFPDDPIVRMNAGILRSVEDQTDRQRQERIAVLLEVALSIR